MKTSKQSKEIVRIVRNDNRKNYLFSNGSTRGGEYINDTELIGYLLDTSIKVDFENRSDKSKTLFDIVLQKMKKFEPKSGDTKMLSRVIRYGGLISYIEILEGPRNP